MKVKEDIISSRKTMEIMNYLYTNPESSSSEIIKELNMSVAVVSIVIGRLKGWNLVIRTDGKKNQERFHYH